MTVFGILWFIIVLWGFIKRDIKYMFSITLLFMTFQCVNVLVVREIGIGPQVLTSILFIFKSLINSNGMMRYNKKNRVIIITSLMLVLTTLISCIYNNIFISSILPLAQLSIYVLCFLCITLFIKTIDSESLYRIIRRIILFILVLGIIQVLTTMEILPLRSPLTILFYNDIRDTVYFHHNDYSRIMSTFMEPSYLAGLLVGGFYYLLSIKKKWKENYLLMVVVIIELILTFSSTAYGAFLLVGLVFIVFQNRISLKFKIGIVLLASIGFIFLYFVSYDILDSVIFSKSESGSYYVRTIMNKSAMELFESSPVFGVGYSNARASSIIYTLLAEIGICGLVVYLLFNLSIFSLIFLHGRNVSVYNEFDIGIRFAVLSAFACQVIACPDLALCTYWFWIYALGASLKRHSERG